MRLNSRIPWKGLKQRNGGIVSGLSGAESQQQNSLEGIETDYQPCLNAPFHLACLNSRIPWKGLKQLKSAKEISFELGLNSRIPWKGLKLDRPPADGMVEIEAVSTAEFPGRD